MPIRVEITAPQPSHTPLRITAEPRMPAIACGARLLEYAGGAVTFNWTVIIGWTGRGAQSQRQFTGISTARDGEATNWPVPFGNPIIGGTFKISVQAKTAQGDTYRAQASPIRIVGTQPTPDATVLQAIGADPWYIRRIARQESGLRQFDANGEPFLNIVPGDGGAGIFQITGTNQTDQDIWNWRQNVATGRRLLANNAQAATAFWNRQVRQFDDWNVAHPNAPVAPPADVTYNDVTFSFNPTGARRSFADAIAIKMNNGATRHFIVWNNGGDHANNPEWRLNETNEGGRNYVSTICNTPGVEAESVVRFGDHPGTLHEPWINSVRPARVPLDPMAPTGYRFEGPGSLPGDRPDHARSRAMTVRDALARGGLGEAIDLAVGLVRDRPLDQAARFTLVDLLGFAGDWSRAARQMDLLADAPGIDVHRLLNRAGRERSGFFAEGDPPPSWLIEPSPWASRHLEACERLRLGDHAGAREGFDEAAGMAQGVVRVEVDGGVFEGFRDLDDRLGPVLELVGPGGYSWVPWEDVRFLDIPPPEALRDLLWAPARVALARGPIGRVYLPTTYPGPRAAEGPFRLGHATDWVDEGSGLATGLGLKMTLAGDRSFGLFELRDLRFLPPDGPPTGPA